MDSFTIFVVFCVQICIGQRVDYASNLFTWSFVWTPIEPEVNMGPGELIKSKGYPYENYTVATKDGFLLKLHRIPHGKNELKGQSFGNPRKPVVYLQHGLMSSSCVWLINLENQSLGYILADAGYDVWIGDSRGNLYSSGHQTLNRSDPKFWDWSWDQLALYDTPALLNQVLKTTQAPYLYYVGHSQGTLIAWAAFSTYTGLGSKVKIVFALAPVLYTSNSNSFYQMLVADRSLIYSLGTLINGPQVIALGRILANYNIRPEGLYRYVYHQLAGPDNGHLNTSRFNVIFGHFLAGTSLKNLHHYGQMAVNNKFQMYDYGSPEDNLAIYKKKKPPSYHMKHYQTPTVLLWALNDTVSEPENVKKLIPLINNLLAEHSFENTNHVDFIHGTNAPIDYYPYIINMIEEIERDNNKRS